MKYNSKHILQVFVLCFVVSILVGFTIFIRQNLIRYKFNLSHKFEIAIFLEDKDISAPEVIGEKIRAIDNMKEINFISKETVKDKLNNLQDEILISGGNPFPDAFSAIPAYIDTINIENIVSNLKEIKGIDEIKYDKNLLEIMEKLEFTTKLTELILKIVLLTLLVISIAGLIINYKNQSFIFKKYLYLLSGIFGTALAILFVGLFKKDSFVPVTLKGYLVILFTGIAVALIEAMEVKSKE